MYEKNNEGPMPTKQAEHLSIATEMGNAITGKFNPDQQNEMVKHIRLMVTEDRQLTIEETEKKLAYLKETFQQL